MTKSFFSSSWAVIVLFLLFVFDRLSKQLAWRFLNGQDLSAWGLSLRLYVNTALAFSLSLNKILIFALIVLVLFFLIFWLVKLLRQGDFKRSFWLALILLAGFSNLWDRWRFGGVLDFVSIYWLPVFNLSDLYITMAVVCLLVLAFRRKKILTNNG